MRLRPRRRREDVLRFVSNKFFRCCLFLFHIFIAYAHREIITFYFNFNCLAKWGGIECVCVCVRGMVRRRRPMSKYRHVWCACCVREGVRGARCRRPSSIVCCFNKTKHRKKKKKKNSIENNWSDHGRCRLGDMMVCRPMRARIYKIEFMRCVNTRYLRHSSVYL